MTERHRLPADWWPDDTSYARAAERNDYLNVEVETWKFVEEMSGSRRTRKDWTAVWRSTLAHRNDELRREEDERMAIDWYQFCASRVKTIADMFPDLQALEQVSAYLDVRSL